MAEALDDDDNNDDIFVYMGGDQQVPTHIRRARIHKSVKIVRATAFYFRYKLIYLEFHDGVEIIEEEAFMGCIALKILKLLGVKIIKESAFNCCSSLTDVDFGDKLELIGRRAFYGCKALTNTRMLSVRIIEERAFGDCFQLSDVEFGEALRTLQDSAFYGCFRLKRIALPMRGDMIEVGVFDSCHELTTIDLIGGAHDTVASLHFESWRNEIMDEINRINHVLPTTAEGKTEEIQQWMRSVINRLDHYKAEYKNLLKEATTLLELALWKANLDNNGDRLEREGARTTRGSRKRARKEICVTSGADVVIKNVLTFLQLPE